MPEGAEAHISERLAFLGIIRAARELQCVKGPTGMRSEVRPGNCEHVRLVTIINSY